MLECTHAPRRAQFLSSHLPPKFEILFYSSQKSSGENRSWISLLLRIFLFLFNSCFYLSILAPEREAKNTYFHFQDFLFSKPFCHLKVYCKVSGDKTNAIRSPMCGFDFKILKFKDSKNAQLKYPKANVHVLFTWSWIL